MALTLQELDAQVTVVHMLPESEVPLQARLYAGHMELVASLMRAQAHLHESGYQSAVRAAVVRPAHVAVMQSAQALAAAAAKGPAC